jgi:hypothetical protein
VTNPLTEPPEQPGLTRIIFGQYCVWDDSPAECFGQMWIPVCVWDRRGPLSGDDGLTCPECRQFTPADPEVTMFSWSTVPFVVLPSSGPQEIPSHRRRRVD